MATRAATRRPKIDAETIARRAYELFEARGYQHGHDGEDWLTAEAQLKAELSTAGKNARGMGRTGTATARKKAR